MALRNLKELQTDADALSPTEQIELANYLLDKAMKTALRVTGDLSEFKGKINLNIDPLDFQRAIRSEWT